MREKWTKQQAAAWAGEARAMLALAWPLVLTNLAQIGMSTVDVVMMGWLGPRALAAGALGANLYIAVVMFGVGLVTATSPMMASALGRRRSSVRDVRRTVRQGLWAACAFALPTWVLLWQAEALLLAMGQDPDLAREAGAYTRAVQWALLPFLWFVVLRSFLAALERPRWALAVGVAGVIFNAGANYLLMFGHFGFPALGLVGAGIATTLATLFMVVVLAVVILLDRRFRRYYVFGRFWRSDWPRFRAIWRLGLPIAAALAFEVTVFNAAVFLMGLIGAQSLAAHSIAIQIAAVAFMVPLGLSQAATVRVGLAHGAQDVGGVRRAGWTAFALSTLFMSMTALAMILAPLPLLGLFLDPNLPDNMPVIALAVGFLAMAGLFQLFDGAQVVGAGMLRGLHDTRVPMIYAALGYWGIGAPLGVLLAFATPLKGLGIWIGLATALAVVAALMLARWIRRERLGLVARPA